MSSSSHFLCSSLFCCTLVIYKLLSSPYQYILTDPKPYLLDLELPYQFKVLILDFFMYEIFELHTNHPEFLVYISVVNGSHPGDLFVCTLLLIFSPIIPNNRSNHYWPLLLHGPIWFFLWVLRSSSCCVNKILLL